MNTHQHVNVDVYSNGIIRVYGNGGLLFETRGDYVTLKTAVDASLPIPSGTAPTKKEDK